MCKCNGADTNEEAKRLSTTSDRFYLNVVSGKKSPLQPPVDSMEGLWNPLEENAVRRMSSYTFKGNRNRITDQLKHSWEHYM